MIQEGEAFLRLDDLHPCTNYSVSLATILNIGDNTDGVVYMSEAINEEFVTAASGYTEFQGFVKNSLCFEAYRIESNYSYRFRYRIAEVLIGAFKTLSSFHFEPNTLPKLNTLTTRTGRAHVTLEWEDGEWPCVDGYDIQMNVNVTGDVVDEAFEFSRVGKMTVATAQGLKSCTTYEVRMATLATTLYFCAIPSLPQIYCGWMKLRSADRFPHLI